MVQSALAAFEHSVTAVPPPPRGSALAVEGRERSADSERFAAGVEGRLLTRGEGNLREEEDEEEVMVFEE